MLDDVLILVQADLIDLATKVGIACVSVFGAGLTIFGLKWVVMKVMHFFQALSDAKFQKEYEEWKSQDHEYVTYL